MNHQVHNNKGVKPHGICEVYPFGFTGMERDEEKEMSGGHFASERGEEPRSGIPYCSVYSYTYFGARYRDHELMTMWLSVDPLADKYPSISPYAYCAWNPVKLVDPDGKEGIVISGAPGNHTNILHFLVNGLDRAKKCKDYFKQNEMKEQTTWIIYNDPKNPTPQRELNKYTKAAHNIGINVKVVDNVDDIIDYINNKDGNGSRENDKISRFYYLGHATTGNLDVGMYGSKENFDPSDLDPKAFRSGAFVDVVGGCRTAVRRHLFNLSWGIPTELSVVDQFTKILDKKSTVVGSNVRVDYRGNVMSNKALLSTNNGEEISKHGKL